MPVSSPQIDRRTASDIAAQVQALLKSYTQASWPGFNLEEAQGVSPALVGVFSRFAEIIIERLNQVPDKNFLAFLDLLGASQLPPQPARVPLTFKLAAGSAVDGVVPPRTQVAAPPAEGEKAAVVFETERELVVTAAELAAIFVRSPEQDKYADHSAIITAAPGPGLFAFAGNRRNEHILYLGHALLHGLSHLKNLRLHFSLTQALGDGAQLQWEFGDGANWSSTIPPLDGTSNFSQNGDIDFGALPAISSSAVNGLESRWLRGRLLAPVTRSAEARLGMVREDQLPEISEIRMTAEVQLALEQGLLPELAFSNNEPIDLGKTFFPFGQEPKPGNVFYLANAEAFSKDAKGLSGNAGARVNLRLEVSNSHLLPGAAGVRPSADLELIWECWDGAIWKNLGVTQRPNWISLLELDPMPELASEAAPVIIKGIAQRGASISITPAPVANTLVIGEDGRFAAQSALLAGLNIVAIRADYQGALFQTWQVIFQGDPLSRMQLLVTLPALPTPIPFAVPAINLIVTAQGSGSNNVFNIKITNGRNPASSISGRNGDPINVALEVGANPLLIEGLNTAGAPVAATTLFLGRAAEEQPPATNPPDFFDGTYALAQSGVVSLKLPAAVAKAVVNGQDNFWLRSRINKGDYGTPAMYRLKNPIKPEDGFTLVLATFRAPMLAQIKIGYEQTLTAGPTHGFIFNHQTYEGLTPSNFSGGQPFKPFVPMPETLPTLYMGFALPVNRALFPNRTLSLFARLAEVKYGERFVPLSPLASKQTGSPGGQVGHKFVVTNAEASQARFTFGVFGTSWPGPIVPDTLDLSAGQSAEIEVKVTLPSDAVSESSDRGFLRMLTMGNTALEHAAVFMTFVDKEPPSTERLMLAWEYWNGAAWTKLLVRDDTENFTRPGLLQFLPPADFAHSLEFELERFWLRVRREKGAHLIEPALHRMLLNTTFAVQTLTITNEILGSSTGRENQTFRAVRSPVLLGQRLEVREPEMPSSEELAALAEKDEEAVTVLRVGSGRPKEIWVRWRETSDFHASGPRDRHYVLDHLTGGVRFGDGLHGLIPPRGSGNVRLAKYQTGGSTAGNRPAGAVTQLKTTVPYVESAANTEAATGGANAESIETLVTRMPRTLRHGYRAVTVEDYEDLALLASPAVARAKCVPLRNLVADPLDEKPASPGELSVIIVAQTTEAKPLPGLELIARVQDYLEANSVPTLSLAVVGPLYVSVNVTAEIALVSLEGASDVEQALQQALENFLHPLHGGFDEKGWAFGREPYKSDFYALLEAVPGVDHVRSLMIEEKVEATEDLAKIKRTGRFLVHSGKHKITLVFEEQ